MGLGFTKTWVQIFSRATQTLYASAAQWDDASLTGWSRILNETLCAQWMTRTPGASHHYDHGYQPVLVGLLHAECVLAY